MFLQHSGTLGRAYPGATDSCCPAPPYRCRRRWDPSTCLQRAPPLPHPPPCLLIHKYVICSAVSMKYAYEKQAFVIVLTPRLSVLAAQHQGSNNRRNNGRNRSSRGANTTSDKTTGGGWDLLQRSRDDPEIFSE